MDYFSKNSLYCAGLVFVGDLKCNYEFAPAQENCTSDQPGFYESSEIWATFRGLDPAKENVCKHATIILFRWRGPGGHSKIVRRVVLLSYSNDYFEELQRVSLRFACFGQPSVLRRSGRSDWSKISGRGASYAR